MNNKSSTNLLSFNLTFDDILGITKAVATPAVAPAAAVLDTPAADPVVNNSKCKYNIYNNYLTAYIIEDNISDDYIKDNNIFNEQPQKHIPIKHKVYSDHAPIFYILPDGLQIIVWNITVWGLSNFGSDSAPIYNHKFNMNRLELFIEYEKRLTNICEALFKLLEDHPNALFFLQECPCPIKTHAEKLIEKLIEKVYKQFITRSASLGFTHFNNINNENNENIIIFKNDHEYMNNNTLKSHETNLENRNKRISKLLYRIDNANKTDLTAYISIHLPYNNLDSTGQPQIKPVFTAILNQLDELFTKDRNIKKITVYICGDFNKQYKDGTITTSDGVTLIPSIQSEFEDIQTNNKYSVYKYKYTNKIYDAQVSSSLKDNNGGLNDKCIDYILECIITID